MFSNGEQKLGVVKVTNEQILMQLVFLDATKKGKYRDELVEFKGLLRVLWR